MPGKVSLYPWPTGPLKPAQVREGPQLSEGGPWG